MEPSDNMDAGTALDRFSRFVSKILTVTKDDIREIEETATDIVRPREPSWDDEETE